MTKTKQEKFEKRYSFRAVDKNGKTLFKISRGLAKKRTFLKRVRTFFDQRTVKYYLKVSYGLFEDVWGEIVPFFNEGWYAGNDIPVSHETVEIDKFDGIDRLHCLAPADQNHN